MSVPVDLTFTLGGEDNPLETATLYTLRAVATYRIVPNLTERAEVQEGLPTEHTTEGEEQPVVRDSNVLLEFHLY